MTEYTRRGALAAIASIVSLSGCVVAAGDRGVTETTTETYDSGDPLAVESDTGDVTIRGEDRDDVRVRAVRSGASEESLDELSLSVDSRDGQLALAADRTDKGIHIGPEPVLDLEIRVPAGHGVARVAGANGDFTLEGVSGPVEIEAVNGDVELRDVSDSVLVTSTNGDLSITRPDGDAAVSSTNGDVTVVLPADPDATVSLESLNGDLTLDGTESESRLASTLGDGSAMTVDVETTNGDVEVTTESA